MKNVISMTQSDWEQLRGHLLQDDVEQAAMTYAQVEPAEGGVHFSAREIELLQSSDFGFQSANHISLTDETRGRIIKRAWDLKLSMVELHSHVGMFASPEFSPTDLDGLFEFVPHARWRLRGAPYAALVIAADGFDGLIWTDDSTAPASLARLDVDDLQFWPTGTTIRKLRGSDGG